MNESSLTPQEILAIEQYYQPPRGLNSLRTHYRLMAFVAVISGMFAPMISPMVAEDIPGVLPELVAFATIFVWIIPALSMIGCIVTYWLSCHRHAIAALHGLPEPGIREWPAFRQNLAARGVTLATAPTRR